jgi:hypothetical protein
LSAAQLWNSSNLFQRLLKSEKLLTVVPTAHKDLERIRTVVVTAKRKIVPVLN